MDPVALFFLRFAPELISTTMTVRSSREWPGVLKWATTGFSVRRFFVTSVCVEANVEGVLCLFHVLLPASSAFNYIDDVAGLACCCSSYVEGLTSGGAFECVSSLDVSASKAAFATTWTAPLVRFVVCRP